MLYKDYDRRCSFEKKILAVSLKKLVAKMNWWAVNPLCKVTQTLTPTESPVRSELVCFRQTYSVQGRWSCGQEFFVRHSTKGKDLVVQQGMERVVGSHRFQALGIECNCKRTAVSPFILSRTRYFRHEYRPTLGNILLRRNSVLKWLIITAAGICNVDCVAWS
jgi:hypothetical protein